MTEAKKFEPTVAGLEVVVSGASDSLMHVISYDNSANDWHCAGGDGFKLIDLKAEDYPNEIYVEKTFPGIEGVETVVLDIVEYCYKLPVTYVPYFLLSYIETTLESYEDEIPYPGVDEDVDFYRPHLEQSIEELKAADTYFRQMGWVDDRALEY